MKIIPEAVRYLLKSEATFGYYLNINIKNHNFSYFNFTLSSLVYFYFEVLS